MICKAYSFLSSERSKSQHLPSWNQLPSSGSCWCRLLPKRRDLELVRFGHPVGAMVIHISACCAGAVGWFPTFSSFPRTCLIHFGFSVSWRSCCPNCFADCSADIVNMASLSSICLVLYCSGSSRKVKKEGEDPEARVTDACRRPRWT